MKLHAKVTILLPLILGALTVIQAPQSQAQTAPKSQQHHKNASLLTLWTDDDYMFQKIGRLKPIAVQKALAAGANINARDSHGRTALIVASHWGEADVARLLLAHGADPSLKDKDGHTALIEASERPEGADKFMVLLVAKQIDYRTKGLGDIFARLALFQARKVAIARALLAKGVDVDARDKANGTALHIAAMSGGMEVVKMLLAKHAEVDAKDNEGRTPLVVACYLDFPNVVKILIAHGADVNARPTDGQTALMISSDLGHEDVVPLLLAKGANVNAKSQEGYTALFLAKGDADTKVVHMLRAKGAKH